LLEQVTIIYPRKGNHTFAKQQISNKMYLESNRNINTSMRKTMISVWFCAFLLQLNRHPDITHFHGL